MLDTLWQLIDLSVAVATDRDKVFLLATGRLACCLILMVVTAALCCCSRVQPWSRDQKASTACLHCSGRHCNRCRLLHDVVTSTIQVAVQSACDVQAYYCRTVFTAKCGLCHCKMSVCPSVCHTLVFYRNG